MHSSNETNAPLVVKSQARPLRAAFLVDSEKVTVGEIDQVIAYATRHWGGRMYGIFPTDGQSIPAEWWDAFVTLDPDVVHALVPIGNELIRRINRTVAPAVLSILEADQRTRHGEDHLLDAGTVGALSVLPLPRFISNAGRAVIREPVFWNIKSNSVLNDDGRFVLRNFGLMEGTIFTDAAFRETRCEEMQANEQTPVKLLERAALQQGLVTPFDLAALDAVYPEWTVPTPKAGGFQLVVGDSPYDVLYAWNRGMYAHGGTGTRTIWVSLAHTQHADFVRIMATFIMRRYWDNTDTSAAVVSYSVPKEQLEPIAVALRRPTSRFVDAFTLQRSEYPHPRSNDRRLRVEPSHEQLVPLTGSRALLSFPKPRFPIDEKTQGRWMVDLWIEYRPERHSHVLGQRPVWRLPRRAGIAHRFFDPHRTARVTGDECLSAWVTAAESAIGLKVPSDRGVLWSFIEKKPYNVQPWKLEDAFRGQLYEMVTSDEGRKLQALVDLFGGLWNASHTLGKPLLRRLIRHLAGSTTAEEDAAEALVLKGILAEEIAKGSTCDVDDLARRLAARSRRVPRERLITWEELRKRYPTWRQEGVRDHLECGRWPASGGLDEEQERDVEDLVHGDVLLQGIDVKCPRCRHSDWIPVDRLAPTIPCSGCREDFPLDPQAPWAFRLNQMCRGAVRDTGTFTVLQAACFLARTRGMGGMFLVVPSQDFYVRDSKDKFGEMDLLAISQGRFLAVEVKSEPRMFLPKTMESVAKVAEELEPDELLLAAPGTMWPDEVMSRISELAAALKPKGIEVQRLELTWP